MITQLLQDPVAALGVVLGLINPILFALLAISPKFFDLILGHGLATRLEQLRQAFQDRRDTRSRLYEELRPIAARLAKAIPSIRQAPPLSAYQQCCDILGELRLEVVMGVASLAQQVDDIDEDLQAANLLHDHQAGQRIAHALQELLQAIHAIRIEGEVT